MRKYNKSIADAAKMKKKVKKIEARQKQIVQPSKFEQKEDGWITVHYKGGRDPTKKYDKSKQKKKEKKKEKLVNFYAFEVKEAKLKKHKELLEKFEEDKKRLAQMRAQRKFKI